MAFAAFGNRYYCVSELLCSAASVAKTFANNGLYAFFGTYFFHVGNFLFAVVREVVEGYYRFEPELLDILYVFF